MAEVERGERETITETERWIEKREDTTISFPAVARCASWRELDEQTFLCSRHFDFAGAFYYGIRPI